MDLDVVHRQVQGLQKFKERVEAFLANSGVDLAAEAGDQALSTRMTALEEHVASVQKTLDDLAPKLADLPAILEGVTSLQKALADAEAENTAGQPAHDAFQARLDGLLTWFDDRKAGLETLLSIGDDFQADVGTTAGGGATFTGGTDSGTANAGAAAAGGAAAAPDGTVDPAAPAAAPASPAPGGTG